MTQCFWSFRCGSRVCGKSAKWEHPRHVERKTLFWSTSMPNPSKSRTFEQSALLKTSVHLFFLLPPWFSMLLKSSCDRGGEQNHLVSTVSRCYNSNNAQSGDELRHRGLWWKKLHVISCVSKCIFEKSLREKFTTFLYILIYTKRLPAHDLGVLLIFLLLIEFASLAWTPTI